MISQMNRNCPPCPAPCKKCPPCQGGQIVQDKPYVEPPPPQSRIQYVPYQRSIIQYEVRERIQRIPKKRKVKDYREQVKMEMVPVEKDVEDFYAVEVLKQYIPQTKQKVQVQKVPVQRISYNVDYVPHTRTRKITKQQNPTIFRGEYEQRIVGTNKGQFTQINPTSIRQGSKITLNDGSVVDYGRFIQMIRSNPTYLQPKIIPGDGLTSSGTGAYQGGYSKGNVVSGGYAVGSGGFGGSGSGGYSSGYTSGGNVVSGGYTSGGNLVSGGYTSGGNVGSSGSYVVNGGSTYPTGGYVVSGGNYGGMSYNGPLTSSGRPIPQGYTLQGSSQEYMFE